MIHPEFSRSVGLGEVLKSFVCSKVSSRFPGSWIANKFHVLYPPIPFISRTSFTSLLDFISLNSSLCTPSSLPNIQPSSITQKPNIPIFKTKLLFFNQVIFQHTNHTKTNETHRHWPVSFFIFRIQRFPWPWGSIIKGQRRPDLRFFDRIFVLRNGVADFWRFLRFFGWKWCFCFYKENGFSTFFSKMALFPHF